MLPEDASVAASPDWERSSIAKRAKYSKSSSPDKLVWVSSPTADAAGRLITAGDHAVSFAPAPVEATRLTELGSTIIGLFVCSFSAETDGSDEALFWSVLWFFFDSNSLPNTPCLRVRCVIPEVLFFWYGTYGVSIPGTPSCAAPVWPAAAAAAAASSRAFLRRWEPNGSSPANQVKLKIASTASTAEALNHGADVLGSVLRIHCKRIEEIELGEYITTRWLPCAPVRRKVAVRSAQFTWLHKSDSPISTASLAAWPLLVTVWVLSWDQDFKPDTTVYATPWAFIHASTSVDRPTATHTVRLSAFSSPVTAFARWAAVSLIVAVINTSSSTILATPGLVTTYVDEVVAVAADTLLGLNIVRFSIAITHAATANTIHRGAINTRITFLRVHEFFMQSSFYKSVWVILHVPTAYVHGFL